MDFTAPSFSLGFDLDDDEPTPPVGTERREQPRGYAAPDAPSFSLGIDFDDDVDEEPRLPAGGRREEQARRSAATDPPSFSLGFDDDDDVEQVRRCELPDAPSFSLGISDDDDEFIADGQHQKQPRSPAAPRAPTSFSFEDEGDFFRRPEAAQREMAPLKRLRKSHAPPHLAPTPPPLKVPGPPAAEVAPVMSENKALDAVGTGSLEDEIEDWTTDEDRPVQDIPPSVGSCSTSSNSKFSLLNRGVLMTQSGTKANISKFTQTPNFSASKPLEESSTKKLLPKITINPMRKIHLVDSDTDADDEQNQTKAKKPASPVKKRQESMHKYMHYFFHDDPRVRDLVSSRLQHFIPTGAGSTRDNEQSRGGSLSCRRQLRSSAAANDEWVTPRIPVATDVGKRRVHARENQSGSGHWFTNDSGKRVYVSKNGQELTGRDAYRQYQKESGRGFNRYKKKGSSGAKGETRAKQSSSGTKRGAAKVKIETAAKRKR